MIGTDDRQRMRPDLLRDALARDLADGVPPLAVVKVFEGRSGRAELGLVIHRHRVAVT